MSQDIFAKVKGCRERASLYFENFEEERRREDREKAGEALWGVVSCLMNAFHIFEKGKPAPKHGYFKRICSAVPCKLF